MNDELLKESLVGLFEEAPCGYVFTDPDGAFLRVNKTFLRWTGYERGELVGARRLQDLLTVPGKIFYENQYVPLLRMQGFVNEVALDIVRRGQEPLPVLVNSVQQPEGAGQPTVVASTVFDATSRRSYERELLRARREAERLAAIVAASDDAILSASAEGVIQTWNPGATRLLRYRAADAVGRHVSDVLPALRSVREWDRVEGELRAGRGVHLETAAEGAGGARVDVSAALTPHLGPLGELSGISSIMRDVRERKEGERRQHEFLAMASHELRNPLASIKGHAQLMRRRGQYEQTGLQTIEAQANHMDRLIDDLLLASQVAADRLVLQLAEVDLVAEARVAAAAQVRPEGAPIRVEAPDEPVIVRADARRLRQVLANLLTNAVKYSPPEADIAVVVSRSGTEARVAVTDRGVGIAEDELPRLFERFYRSSATAGQARGVGLGLYITRELVRAHGGEIGVESEVGRGSTFTVTLPLAPAA